MFTRVAFKTFVHTSNAKTEWQMGLYLLAHSDGLRNRLDGAEATELLPLLEVAGVAANVLTVGHVYPVSFLAVSAAVANAPGRNARTTNNATTVKTARKNTWFVLTK
ncbi:hypothetical protein NX059_006359 [Plenodomus lindquistii]|nr:hypothetical protein NX059_006359 [Plenodomus lindquistii]